MNRIATLDVFRGLAAVAVMLFHYLTRYGEIYSTHPDLGIGFVGGYLGVHFFFIVSGFVILMTLQRTQRAGDFVVSRFSRLFPTYWVCIVITLTFLAVGSLNDSEQTLGTIAVNFTMLQDFFAVPRVDGVYWSLTCELLFYVLMWLLFVSGQLPRLTIYMALWLLAQTSAVLFEQAFGWFPYTVEFYLNLRNCHLFVAGMLFYRMYSNTQGRYDYWLLSLCAVNLLLLPSELHLSAIPEKSLLLSFFGLFFLFSKGYLKLGGGNILTFLGAISYALYLLHQNVGYVVIKALDERGSPGLLSVAAAIAVTIVLAALVTFAIERPAIRLIRSSYRRSVSA